MASGFIRFPADGDAGTGTRHQATLTGDGAIAQGAGATALAAGAVQVNGPVGGNVITGTVKISTQRHRP